MSLNLQSSKDVILPDPEKIEDIEVKSVFKKLMAGSEDDRIKLYEDLKALYRILAGIDAMQNVFKSQNIIPATDDTYYLGEIGSPFKAYKGIILKDQAGTGKHYRLEVYNDALRIVALD